MKAGLPHPQRSKVDREEQKKSEYTKKHAALLGGVLSKWS